MPFSLPKHPIFRNRRVIILKSGPPLALKPPTELTNYRSPPRALSFGAEELEEFNARLKTVIGFEKVAASPFERDHGTAVRQLTASAQHNRTLYIYCFCAVVHKFTCSVFPEPLRLIDFRRESRPELRSRLRCFLTIVQSSQFGAQEAQGEAMSLK